MAGKNKKNKNKDSKQPQQESDFSKNTEAPEVPVETKNQAEKTQTTLASQPKVEQVPNDIRVNQSNSVSEDLKVEPSKNIDQPIESKIRQSTNQTPNLQANTQRQQEPERIQQPNQIPAQQSESKVEQAQVQGAKHQLPVQHTTQPLQVIQERSGENLTSLTPYQEVQHSQTEESNRNVSQNKAQEVIPQKSSNVQPERHKTQVVDTLPVQSQHVKENELEKAAQISQRQNEAEAQSLPQRQLEVVPESQHKVVSQSNLQKLIQKQQQKPLVVPQNLNNTQSFVSIEGEQERQRQLRQAFTAVNQTLSQQNSQKVQPVIQNKTEQSNPSNPVINQNEVSENKELLVNQQQGHKQVNIQNSVDNIQILQHSAPYQVEVQEEGKFVLPQNEGINERICLTESVDVQKLIESQERPVETQTQAQKVEVKPEVVEVQDGSNNVLDINQAIQLVQAVKEVPLLPPYQAPRAPVLACQLQRQPQKVQNRQVIVKEYNDPADNKIFTLVQSQQIPVDKQINIEVSTQIAATKINVKESLSFSDLNFSVERSAGKQSISGNHESQRKQQVKENAESTQPEVLPKEENLAEIIQPVKTIEVHYTNLNQPIKGLEQSLHRPVEVLIQQKVVAQVQKIVEVRYVSQVRVEPPSEVVSVLVENTAQIPIKSEIVEVLKENESNNEQKEGESNVTQRQDLSTSNKQAIVQEARSKEEVQVRLAINNENNRDEKKQKPKKNPSSLVQKIVISSSTIIVGGIAWGLTKSPQKSLLFSAIGLGAGLITAQLLK